MATYDQNTGMWLDANGGWHSTAEEADTADRNAGAAQNTANNAARTRSPTDARAASQQALIAGNGHGAAGQSGASARTQASQVPQPDPGYTTLASGYGQLQQDAGPNNAPIGGGNVQTTVGNGVATPSAPTPVVSGRASGASAPTGRQFDAASTYGDIYGNIENAEADREANKQALLDKWGSVQWDNSDNAQSREMQGNAAKMYQSTYDKLAAYDPQAEAKRENDEALQRQMTIGRSAAGGAAAKQSAMFQALQQAPQIQQQAASDAEAKREHLVSDTLNAAQGYGAVATGTRGQDIQTQQAEGQLGVEVAAGMTGVMQHADDLTQDDMKFLGQMRTALAGLEAQFEGLTEQEREDRVNDILKKQGLDQQWKEFKQSQKVTAKDVLGAIFTLGGEAAKGGFQLAGINAMRK